ncbi:MAG: hypothetical protein WC551_11895 [Patescibacteria group bacterium]
MQDREFRRNCELRAMDEPVTKQQALEALDSIVKNPQRDVEDTRTLNQAVSVLENFIYIHAETESKARVYKSAVDQLADSMAAGAWQDGPAPKDGSWILGLFYGLPYVVGYDSWDVGGEMLPDGSGSPPDGHESGWCLAGENLHVMDKDEPEKWARIIHPNRHMPASWDGPGDCG